MDPNISFSERAKLAKELLSKQEPVTLNQARAQVLCLKIYSSSNKNKEEDIKYHLEMYYPNWTKEQIEKVCAELLEFRQLSFKETLCAINNKFENYR